MIKIIIQQNSIEFLKDEKSLGQINIPVEVVNHQELLDIASFKKLIADFAAETKLKDNEAAVFLSEELVYSKDVEDEDQASQFLSKVPFAKAASIKVKKDKGMQVLATNGEIIEGLKEALADLSIKIKIVTLSANPKMDKSMDFLNQETQMSQNNQKSFLQKNIWLILLVSLLLIGFIVGALYFRFKFTSKINEKEVTTVTTAVIVSPTPQAPQLIKVSKEEMEIQVLNGSGIAGQAGKVKEQLEALGYKNIQTGNAEVNEEETTVILFKTSVASESAQEIIEGVKKVVKEVTQESTESAGVDVLITTR